MREAICGISLLAMGVTALPEGDALAQTMPAMGNPGDRVTIEARGKVSYSTNVAGGDSSLADLRGLEPEDVVYSPALSITLQQPLARQMLFLQADGNLQRHQNNKTLDSENVSATTGAAGRFGPCGGSAIAGYSRRRSDVAELLNVATKNIATQRFVQGQATCAAGSIQTGFSARRAKLDNSGNSAGYTDSTTDNLSAQVGYGNAQLGVLSVTGQYSRVTYEASGDPTIPTQPTFQTYSAGLSYQRKIGRRLNGQAQASYTTVDEDGPAGSFNSWSAAASLQYLLSERARLEFQYDRGVQASRNVFSTFSLNETFALTGTYALSQRISLRLGGSYQEDDFRGPVGPGPQVEDDQRWTVSGSATMKVGRQVSVDLSASQSKRKTNLPQFDEEATRVSLGVVSKF